MSEPADARRVEVQISWHASSLTRAIATCAGTALAAALITGRWELIAFAAPLLGVLCAVGFGRTTSPVHGYGRPVQARCFENEQSTFEVWASADDAEVPVLVDVVVPEGMSVETIEAVGDRRTVAVAAPRWGR